MSRKHFTLGLLGWPLEHSLSPVIHAAALRACKLKGEYLLYPVPPLPAGAEPLSALLDDLRLGEIDGLNVTVPHKRSVLSLLDRLTPVADAIGAVNVILREGNGLTGDNTDVDGFLSDLETTLSPRVGCALILGAGGAGRAAELRSRKPARSAHRRQTGLRVLRNPRPRNRSDGCARRVVRNIGGAERRRRRATG